MTGNFSATDADTTDVLSYTIQTTPAEGAVTNNHDGTFSFDPGSDFQDLAAGETRDVTFTYVAVDDSGTGNATSDPKTVTITVTGTNDQPIAEVVSISATEDGTAVTGNFSATDADTTDVLSYTIQTTPAEGAVTNNHDGTFSFDPGSDFQDLAAGETRNVTFTYVAVDDSGTGNATSDPKTVTITVTGTNDQPIAEVVSISATEDGTAVTGNFSATDADTTDVLSYTIQTTPAEGAVTNNHDGTFSFDPGSDFQDLAAGETRNVTFTYVAVDDSGTGNATSDPKTVTITVTGTNDQPIAEVVSISATEDGTAVTGNFSATDGDTTDVLSYTIQTTPAEGAVTNNHDGTFSFDPGSDFQDLAAGETRNVTFTYVAVDDSGAANATSDPKTVTITVTGTNDQPIAEVVSISATEDGTAVTGNFSATDGDTTDVLSYTIQTTPAEGAVTNNHDGTFSFDPGSDFQDLAAGETRNVTFTYVAVDDSGAANATSDPKTVTITVTGTNDQPIAEVVSISATEDGTAVTGNFSATDADTTDVLSYTIQTTPAEGAVTNNHDGTFSFDPGSDFQDLAAGETRNVTFTYVAVDDSGTGNATSAPKTVTITVTGTNDAPVVSAIDPMSYTANGDLRVIDSSIDISDVDSALLQGAQVQISGNYQSGEDILGFLDQNGITGSWDANTGTLTLTGAATLADYELALESVTYQNTSNDRNTSPRTVSVSVNDGFDNSALATSTISVSQFNQIPGIIDQNYSLSLTGNSTDYLIANPVSGFPSNSFTIETWVKTGGNSEGIFSYAVPSNHNEILLFGQEDLGLYIGDASIYTGINIADDAWHHVAWTWESVTGTTKVFIDGVEQFSGTLKQGYTIQDGGALVFGQEQDSVGGGFDNSQAYEGLIRDIRVWDAARSQTEIDTDKDKALGGTETNLVSYYPMSGGSGDVVDAGPARNDLIRYGASWLETPRETGENKPFTITTLSFSDADSGTDTVEVILSVTNGALELASLAGITIISGTNNSASMTLQGNIADLNTAINGLKYNPNTGFLGTATLTASINDLGNSDGADAQSMSINRVITVLDIAAPVRQGLIVNGDQLIVTFDEVLSLSDIPDTGAFVVSLFGGASRAINNVAINGSEIILTLDSAVLETDIVRLSYNQSSASNNGGSPLQDSESNQVEDFANILVDNNTDITPPLLDSAIVDRDILTLTYSEDLNESVTVVGFSVLVGGSNRTILNTTVSNNQVTLHLASSVADGENVSINYTPPLTDGNLNNDRIEDLSGNDAIALTNTPVSNVTDSISPSLQSSEVNGETLTLTLNEPLNNNAFINPSLFTVTVENQNRSVLSVAISGSGVILTLSEAVNDGETVSFGYTPPTNSDLLNNDRIEDEAGNDTITITNQPVTNITNTEGNPIVTRVYSDDANQWYQAGSTITIKIEFSEKVNVTGFPQLQLETGTLDRTAVYNGGSGTNTLSFSYTIQTPDESADLNVISNSALTLNGGVIADLLGNNATLQLPDINSNNSLSGQNDIRIDSVNPTAGLVSSSLVNDAGVLILKGSGFNTLLSPGESQDTDLMNRLDWSKFSWRVVDNSGSNTDIGFVSTDISTAIATSDTDLQIQISSTKMNALRAISGFGDSQGQDLIRITSDGFFQDAAGNTMADANTAGVQVSVLSPDGVAPSVTNITALTADGEYVAGSLISLRVSFDEPVTVDGYPILLLGTGSQIRAAGYVSGAGTTDLLFEYLVQEGDETADLDAYSANSLQLNGGAIQDISGNNAALLIPVGANSNSLESQADIAIDAVAPEVMITSINLEPEGADNQLLTLNGSGFETMLAISESAGHILSGDNLSRLDWSKMALKFKQSDNSFETVNFLQNDIGEVRVYSNRLEIVIDNGANKITDNNGFSTISNDLSLTLADGFVGDQAGNQAANDGVTDAVVNLLTNGATVVNVTADTLDGSYKTGDEIFIRVRFSEKVILQNYDANNDALLMLLNDNNPAGNGLGSHATYVSGSGSRELVFSHTISTGDNANDLDYRDIKGLGFESQLLRSDTGLIPLLNANNDQGFVVSASGNAGANYEAYRAFDNTAADSSNNQGSWAVNGASGWLQVQLPSPIEIWKYSLKNIESTNTRAPNSWVLEGSNDGTNFVTLDTQNGINDWDNREIKEFTLNSGANYQYYRINISANNGDSFTGLDGFQLFEGSGTVASLINGTGTEARLGFEDDGIIPILSSASEQNISVSASGDAGANYEAYHAFDDIQASASNNQGSWAVLGASGWLQVELAQPRYIREYSLTAIEARVGREPESWTLQGSHDGVDFVTLDTESGVNNWENRESKSFEIDNPDDFRFYRLSITNNNGDSYTGLDGFQLFEGGLPPLGSDSSLAGNSNIVIDTTPPQPTITSSAYDEDNRQLVLKGSDFDQLLNANESLASDLKTRLDWSKLTIDVNKDGTYTQDILFTVSDIESARLAGTDTLTIKLSAAKALEFESSAGYMGAEDGLDIQTGFLRDLAGNKAAANTNDLTLDYSDIAAPSVINVQAENSGAYKPGDQVAILLQLSESVNISGVNPADDNTKPSISLDNGAIALYDSGSGSDTLRFIYTVGNSSNENTVSLNYISETSFSIPVGVTVLDTAGLEIETTLPALNSNNSLANNADLSIDVDIPEIIEIRSLTPDGDYGEGRLIRIEATLSEAVTVSGLPALNLNNGAQAIYANGSGTNKLIFDYTIVAGDDIASLDVLSTLDLANGSIQDIAGNNTSSSINLTGIDLTNINLNNPMTLWNFDSSSGNTVDDVADGDSINDQATLVNGAQLVSGGQSGQALSLDGTNDYVSVGSSTEINSYSGTISSRTISLAFKPAPGNTLANRQFLFEEGGATNGLNIYIENNTLYMGAWSESTGWNGTWLQTDITGLDPSQWHNVALVLDGDNGKIKGYFNDTLLGSGYGEPVSSHASTYIGAQIGSSKIHTGDLSSSGYYFEGLIDDVQIHNDILPPVPNIFSDQSDITVDTELNFDLELFFHRTNQFLFDIDTGDWGIGAGNDLSLLYDVDWEKFVIVGTNDYGLTVEFRFQEQDIDFFRQHSSNGLKKRTQLQLTDEGYERFLNWEGMSNFFTIGSPKVQSPFTEMDLRIESGWLTDKAGNETSYSYNGPLMHNSTNSFDSYSEAQPKLKTIKAISNNGFYKEGDTIEIEVRYNQKIKVDTSGGTPTLSLTNGATAVFIKQEPGVTDTHNSSRMIFEYTVQSGDNIVTIQHPVKEGCRNSS